MIRQPTPDDTLLRWHTQALAGNAPPTHPDWPEVGWFKLRRVAGGPWVPTLLWVDREVDAQGELTGPETIRASAWGEDEDPVKLWSWLTPISEREYNALTKERLATQHIYDPKRAIDIGAAPTPPGGRR